jgi:hypothetical protein
MKRFLSVALTLAAIMLPLATHAETISYATSSSDHTLRGTILSIDGKYGLTLRDEQADADRVTLHRGTVITPTGLRLKPGMQVTIAGHRDGATFAADAIVAPARYLEDQQREDGAGTNAVPPPPPSSPNGTFQTKGPSAEGGG